MRWHSTDITIRVSIAARQETLGLEARADTTMPLSKFDPDLAADWDAGELSWDELATRVAESPLEENAGFGVGASIKGGGR